MLLKYTKTSSAGTGAVGSSSSTSATFIARGTGMRMTMSTASTMTARIQRKGFRTPSKRHPGKALPGKLHSISRIGPGKLVPGKRISQRPHPPPCDNSNDSGFGFDQHVEVPQQQQQQQQQQAQQQQQQQQQPQQQSSSSLISNNINSSSSSSSSSSGSSSGSGTSTNLSSNNNSHHHHNHHNHHHHSPTAIQHSPQQHLIRAIPASRSTAAKNLPYTSTNENDDEDDDDFCTDDSSDFYGNLNLCSPNSLPSAGPAAAAPTLLALSSSSVSSLSHYEHDDGQSLTKRKKHETHVELDNDDACSEDAFIRKIAEQRIPAVPAVAPPIIMAPTKFLSSGGRSMARVAHKRQPATPLNSVATSSDGRVQLEIVSQPEQQHRARYQTEGSRGAVKDRSGNGFPIVRLIGYHKQAVLQVFIGTDIGRVAPHMFYQACKVAGKNSTQCNEKKVDGTMVIEIDFKPDTEMTITCDCVGILKERNVDVEHRFPDHLAQKNKKKSTRCRMVFRTQLTHEDGTTEMLQVCSNPIICTQPPGVPEICKKSLNSCPVDGGLELFIIGKNFLKDTHVIFQETYESSNTDDPTSEIAVRQQMGGALWEQTVLPDKEYLQQTHLICTVPPYINQNILKPVTVQVSIISSGKKSESHSFAYTPKGSYTALAAATTLSSTLHGSLSAAQDANTFMDTSDPLATSVNTGTSLWPANETKHEIDSGMMPPPISTQIPMGVRRPSLPTNATPMITDQQLAHLNAVAAEALKTELLDETSQNSLVEAMHSPEGTSHCDPHSPNAMQYHSRYGRKASMEAMMYDSNSMPSFPVTPATVVAAAAEVAAVAEMAAAVKMAGITKDILLNAAVVQQQQQQQQSTIDKFIADQTCAAFGVDNAAAIDHALTNILQQASNAQQTAVLERTLSISSNSSSHSSSSGLGSPLSGGGGGGATGGSPNNSLNGHISPITQDIILNSEPAAALSALPIQQLLPHSGASSATAADVGGGVIAQPANAAGLSADIIMNPAVSPSTILCSANGAATAVVPNIMAPHQVTMANSILNDIAMQPQPTQQDAAVAALALSNIIMSPTTAAGGGVNDVDVSVAAPAATVQPVTAATSTAVSNMIIKAAADFISNQEQQTHHQHHHQQQQQHHHHQQQQHQQQQLMNHASSSPTTTTAPLVNLLLNHQDVVPSAATAAAAVAASVVSAAELPQPQFPMGITPAVQQEPLIVALATENALQKSVAAAAVTTNGAVVTQQTAASTAGIHTAGGAVVTVGAPGVPIPPPIPQELTSMSDQDLISYINPSTFDQI